MMDLNKVLEWVQENIKGNLICIYYTGSSIFCNNCNDLDIVVIVDDDIPYRKLGRFDNCDVFQYSLQGIKDYSEFKYENSRFCLYLIALMLAKDNNLIYGEIPLNEYDWFSYKDKIIKAALQQGKKLDFNIKYTNTENATMCLKHTIWIFANYFALENNSFVFTPKQKEILQKCHDNELPRSYANELYSKLLEMQDSQEALNENIN